MVFVVDHRDERVHQERQDVHKDRAQFRDGLPDSLEKTWGFSGSHRSTVSAKDDDTG